MKKHLKRTLAVVLSATLMASAGVAMLSVSAGAEELERHVIYSFSFDEEDASTIYKKAGATPGYINHEVFAGDEETGGSLALTISAAEMTGRGGVLPYIWPDGISGVFNAQDDLGEGEYYELKVDIAWDGGVEVAKKGAYVYPFVLTNGGSENYMTATDTTLQIGPEFQTFVYRLYKVSPDGYQEFDPPQPGSDSGGIAFCCEGSLRKGKTLYIDNIEFARVGGDYKEPAEGTIRYLTPAVAPEYYEPIDEEGYTYDGKKMEMLYENDYEDPSRAPVFGHWNTEISKAFILDTKDSYKNDNTRVGFYRIPKLKPGNFYTDPDIGYYPVIWFWNEEMRDVYKAQEPLGDNDYYVFQFDIWAKGAYAYPSLMVGDEEYAPTYEWDSTGRTGSEAVQPFNGEFVTRYYVFKIPGLDVASANTAFAMFTDGYVNQSQPVYIDNFKFYSVRAPKVDPEPTETEIEPTETFDEPTTAPTKATQAPTKKPTKKTTAPTEAPIVYGDVNGDGVVNMKDVLALRKHIAGVVIDIHFDAADTNADDVVNLKDVLALRKFIAGIAKELPIKA